MILGVILSLDGDPFVSFVNVDIDILLSVNAKKTSSKFLESAFDLGSDLEVTQK